MLIVFQVVAFLILSAVSYTVIVLAISVGRRERCRIKAYEKSLEHLERRFADEVQLRQVRKRRDELTWQGYRKLEVRKKELLDKSGICALELAPRGGQPLPPYKPGQFLTFKLVIGREKQTVVRCYSLADCYRAEENCYRIVVKKVLRPTTKPDVPDGLVSSYFYDNVREGELLDVRAPAGNFVLDSSRDAPVVLVAGGIGITPLWSMLNEIVRRNSARDTWLFYGVRHGGERIFREKLARIRSSHENVNVRICYSSPREGDRKGTDYDHEGRITIEYLKQEIPTHEFEYYICGPPPMMSTLTKGLKAWGVLPSSIRTEAFCTPARELSKTSMRTIDAQHAQGVEVSFAKSERTIRWDSEANNLLEFARANGISMESGCEAGSCGECKVAVRKGEVDYISEPGLDCEIDCCLTCIAVPRENVVLEA
ncbi:MAG: 2Fe-2S iron-sulfur cluster-binding protein [Phycisphaerae bacterium]